MNIQIIMYSNQRKMMPQRYKHFTTIATFFEKIISKRDGRRAGRASAALSECFAVPAGAHLANGGRIELMF